MLNFVIGPACSGKSYFIKATFPGFKVVDLWDYQKNYDSFTIENILNSYEDALEALKDAVKKYDNVVLEHTLLKAKRRKVYIEAVKDVSEINCYVMMPSMENYKEFCRQRKILPDTSEFHFLEQPKLEEGFSNIFMVSPKC